MKRLVLALCLLVVSPLLVAQQNAKRLPQNAAPKSGFRTEFLSDLDDVQKKIMDLAAAVPADKYAWRPNKDVRSVSEVYMHIAGGNYFLATFLGVKPPEDMPKDLEKITDKKDVLAALQKSFDHIRTIMKNTTDADFDKAVKLFGNPTTQRGVYVTMLNHLHEHLGQSIAYARMNNVTPPWSKTE
ncbi:MAG TPA: DinB family protein [Thermoanaerobaculia bacterium]|nr:DinB family protein [Thermoanaerobaculia bacterium]